MHIKKCLLKCIYTGGFCNELEVVVFTSQAEKTVQKQIETAVSTLDTEHIKVTMII